MSTKEPPLSKMIKTPTKIIKTAIKPQTPTKKHSTISQKLQQKSLTHETYNNAIAALQEDNIPKLLPCRSTEKQLIKSFILNGIENCGCSQALYISGVPGIGKTALLNEVMKEIKESKDQQMQIIWLNGMELKNPEKLYSILLQEMSGIRKKVEKAAFIVNDIFRNGRGGKILLVVLDELDYLFTNDQKLLYNIFD